jgi:DNA-directed RNA polymerase specialized sigma24 family protein
MDEAFISETERAERASAALTRLERDILVLSAGLGLDCAAIADRLGIREARAERLLARALRKFDRALQHKARPWWRFW